MTKKRKIREVDVYLPYYDLDTVDIMAPIEPDPNEPFGWVDYTNNLETFDNEGNNITETETRYYEGIANFSAPDAWGERYVIIYAVDADEEHKRDYGVLVDPATALTKIMIADKLDLLDDPEFADLKKLYLEEFNPPKLSLVK